ncbi:MAG: hypothetical protein K2F90_00030 [Clostridiales bacterium]|nr:hypothetical protein [Clostridiales bacterium]
MSKTKKKLRISSIIAAILIILFILSGFLIFVLRPWIVLVINGAEMLIYGIVFRRVGVSYVFVIITYVIIVVLSILIVVFRHDFDLNWSAIIYTVLVGVFIGLTVFITFFQFHESRYPASAVNVTGPLGCIGGWAVLILFAPTEFGSFITGFIIAILYSVLTWFIKACITGWINDSDDGGSGGTSKTYDIYIVEHDD